MSEIVIGVDAGTSVVKSVAFDLDGRLVGVASTPNRYHVGAAGAVTQSLGDVWEDCAKTLRELVAKLGSAQIVGVGVTAQGDGTWLVGKGDAPVGDAWLWLDGRAGPTVRRLRENPADAARFYKTGTALNTCQQGAQLAHMLAFEPERLAVAEAAMHAKDWLFLNLTSVRATDPSEASFTFGDFRTRAYDDDVIAALGLAAQRRLPPDLIDDAAQAPPLTAAAAPSILSSCLGAPVRVSLNEEGGASGAAMIAACAVGAFPHMNAAIAKWAAPPQAPDSRLARIYDEKCSAYAMGRMRWSRSGIDWRMQRAAAP